MKYLFLSISIIIAFSCSNKKQDPNQKITVKSPFSAQAKILEDCDYTDIIYPTTDICTKDYRIEVYRGDDTPGSGRVFLWMTDTLLGKTHWYTKNFFLDSLKYPFTGNNSNYIVNIDSATGQLGVSKWNTLKIPAANIVGSVPSSTDFSAPSAGNTITSGSAFQPNSSAASFILVNASLSGLVGVNGTVTVATSPTSAGTYTTVANDALGIALLGVGTKSLSSIPVPKGYWVKITLGGGTAPTATYTKWSLQ